MFQCKGETVDQKFIGVDSRRGGELGGNKEYQRHYLPGVKCRENTSRHRLLQRGSPEICPQACLPSTAIPVLPLKTTCQTWPQRKRTPPLIALCPLQNHRREKGIGCLVLHGADECPCGPQPRASSPPKPSPSVARLALALLTKSMRQVQGDGLLVG